MSSFIKFLTQSYPDSSKCEVCGGNPYLCHCDDTPAIDCPQLTTMYHLVSHKRQVAERHTIKYRALVACGWVELEQ